MAFLANPGIDLHVCLNGGLQAAVAQTFDFFDICQTGTRRKAVGLRT